MIPAIHKTFAEKVAEVAITPTLTTEQLNTIASHIPAGKDGKDGKDGGQGNPGERGSDASVTKSNVESVLIGVITTHSHIQNLINVTLTIGTINT